MRGNTTRYYEVRVTGQRGKVRGFALCGTYKEAMGELEKRATPYPKVSVIFCCNPHSDTPYFVRII